MAAAIPNTRIVLQFISQKPPVLEHRQKPSRTP
jgi:hypothetical protein